MILFLVNSNILNHPDGNGDDPDYEGVNHIIHPCPIHFRNYDDGLFLLQQNGMHHNFLWEQTQQVDLLWSTHNASHTVFCSHQSYSFYF